MLRPFVHKKAGRAGARCRIPGTTRKDGIMVMYNETDVGLLMFRFITQDYLEIQLPLELDRLAKEGKDYLHGRIELLQSQLEPARKERQADQTIELYDSKPNELGSAVFADHKNRKPGVLH
jgi:hypothetical protein